MKFLNKKTLITTLLTFVTMSSLAFGPNSFTTPRPGQPVQKVSMKNMLARYVSPLANGKSVRASLVVVDKDNVPYVVDVMLFYGDDNGDRFGFYLDPKSKAGKIALEHNFIAAFVRSDSGQDEFQINGGAAINYSLSKKGAVLYTLDPREAIFSQLENGKMESTMIEWQTGHWILSGTSTRQCAYANAC